MEYPKLPRDPAQKNSPQKPILQPDIDLATAAMQVQGNLGGLRKYGPDSEPTIQAPVYYSDGGREAKNTLHATLIRSPFPVHREEKNKSLLSQEKASGEIHRIQGGDFKLGYSPED